MDLSKSIDRITEMRKLKGWSVNHLLINRCGLSKSVIDNMKAGSMPSADKIERIAKELETTSAYLLCETDNPAPPNTKEEAPVTTTGALRDYFYKKTGREPTPDELEQIDQFADTFIKGMNK
jgi:transcriptional regulator with XRE-family HTH domain